MFPQIPTLPITDFTISQLQRNILQSLNIVLKTPFLDGVMLEDVSLLSASTNIIAHKLGRKYQGYFITKLNANSVIWVGATTEADTYIKLNCSANCTVNIWVF